MSDSFKALCSDFYVNQKLQVKMDLPRSRETVLDLFERVRKQFPGMSQFRRYRDELALESPHRDGSHQWLAIRNNNVRSGSVNPTSPSDGYSLHTHVLEAAPFYLNISALDIEYVELLYGFDLLAAGNHDAIVFDALFARSPLGSLADIPGSTPADCQPLVGFALPGRDNVQAHFEVKTHPTGHGGPRDPEAPPEPISVYLTVRRFGVVKDIKDLPEVLRALATRGEELVESRVVPHILTPLREAIHSGPG